MRKPVLTTVAAIAMTTTAMAGSDTYVYLCKDHHGSYPAALTCTGKSDGVESCTLTWRGKTYHDMKPSEGCRYAWSGTDNGVTVNLCTATQGVADLTIGKEKFDCQMPLRARNRR